MTCSTTLSAHQVRGVGLEQGLPYPLGASVRDSGVNFAVFSEHARAIELCLFDASGEQETQRLALHGPYHGVFHGFLPGATAGCVYGLRAHGPYAPQRGHRFNPNKLLLDPYAREILGRFAWVSEHHGYSPNHGDGLASYDQRDNAALALKARVAAPLPPLAPLKPCLDSAEVLLYEVHVKGFSKTLPEVPADMRGTYAGLAHPASVAHFKKLGVTTLSLLPVHYGLSEAALVARGASNYWGYNTLGFCCPDPRWSMQPDDPSAVNAEFHAMVQSLHAAGLEVVLDVVFNHTAEGNECGPTLSFRGLDNASYYRLLPDDASRYENLTGCGNTLHVAHPRVTQFVLDALRYWVECMGVDGFRFDLAPVLGRDAQGFATQAVFFTALLQDPVLSTVRLIAEPWDGGPNGYQLGGFPGAFLEWNDKFRDAVRGYWLQRGVPRGELARRFMGSSDWFERRQRRPTASVNFISVHDGFTLRDVVSYSRKHNLANGENNADGRSDELCANGGVEGPSDDPALLAWRDRVRRAMLATLLLAQGTPMLCAGDEIGKTQNGNNNAYCQDNALSWLDWAHAEPQLSHFVAQTVALRRRFPILRHSDWFAQRCADAHAPSVRWFQLQGQELDASAWQDPTPSAFACWLRDGPTQLWLVFNPTAQALSCVLPVRHWRVLLDSSACLPMAAPCDEQLEVAAHSVLLLHRDNT